MSLVSEEADSCGLADHVYSLRHECIVCKHITLTVQEYMHFDPPRNISSLDFSFEASWLVYYLSQPLFADSSSHEVKQLALIVFDKHPREKWALLALMNSNQIKKALQMESPRETPDR